MELRAIRSLLRLAEHGSITAAGSAAVHKQPRALEQELGPRVHSQLGNHLTLTEEVGAVRLSGGSPSASTRCPACSSASSSAIRRSTFRWNRGNIPAVLEDLRKGAIDLAFMASGDVPGSVPDMLMTSRTCPRT